MKNPRFVLFALLSWLFMMEGSAQEANSYSLKSTFGSIETCNYKTNGIFVAWWDKNFEYSSQAEELLNTLVDIRIECLEDFHMADPPNPLAGYYYNVYIHNGQDLFPDGWAMGQGTDTNGFPFLTIPIGYARSNNAGLQHEGFHIFQYRANSPGFAYSGDSQWYVEATANWYAALKHPNEPESYVTATAVTYNPQLPMWYTFNNREPEDQANWQRYCHQYGMNIFVNYLTEVRDIPKETIVGGFFAHTEQLPQEYLYKLIGPNVFSELYADFAAHNVGGFEFFPPGTASRSYEELRNYGDLKDVHPLVETYTNSGTNGDWVRPPLDFVTRAWSYNVYKIKNSEDAWYQFELQGDSLGSDGASAEFKGRVVVKNGSSISYHDLEMQDLLKGNLSLRAEADEEEIYLLIVSTPLCFRGNQKFSYQVKITRSSASSVYLDSRNNLLGANFPNPFNASTEIPYQLKKTCPVLLRITDLHGRLVLEKMEGIKEAGNHRILLGSENLNSGTYFYSLKMGDQTISRTMIINK